MVSDNIKIQIAYALPHHYFLKSYQVSENTTIEQAILQSGILDKYTEIDLTNNSVGIFSRPAKLSDIVNDGDRIEIYRPLLNDPKEIRRQRAEQQKEKERLQKDTLKQQRQAEKIKLQEEK